MSFLNKELNQYVSKPKSDEKNSYFNIKESTLNKAGNKITFEIVAYYGKNISEKYVKTVK